MEGTKKRNNRGFSLVEVIVVVAILMSLMGISGYYYQQWRERYNAEVQVKMMHADIMQARLKAMEKNRLHFAVLNGSVYQIVEDTNDSGTADAAPPDTMLLSKTLKYPPSSSVTIVMDTRGIISTITPTSSLASPLSVQFSTGAASPEYDCFLLYATRISIGKMTGAACVTR